ncbi:MAG TPA: DUF4231 domain-containing protein [Candidatus Paceibacterota bacterium]
MTVKEQEGQEPDSGYLRLEDQIAWYDHKSMSSQRHYKRVKIAEVICTVLVPIMANINALVTAALGGAAIVLETFEQINQWQHNWITYRSTCESLRHEKYSYLSKSGDYEVQTEEEAKRLLAQRVESLISTEHSKWILHQEHKINKQKDLQK